MRTLRNLDRTKASDHAILLGRRLSAPAREIMRVLPVSLAEIAERMVLNVPAVGSMVNVPIELLLTPLPGAPRWLLQLRSAATDWPMEFFEGEIRVDDSSPTSTELQLVGRLTIPKELIGSNVSGHIMRELVEEAITHVFNSLCPEIEVVRSVSHGPNGHRPSRQAAIGAQHPPRQALAVGCSTRHRARLRTNESAD